jgi:hypothetical protein
MRKAPAPGTANARVTKSPSQVDLAEAEFVSFVRARGGPSRFMLRLLRASNKNSDQETGLRSGNRESLLAFTESIHADASAGVNRSIAFQLTACLSADFWFGHFARRRSEQQNRTFDGPCTAVFARASRPRSVADTPMVRAVMRGWHRVPP